MCGICGFNWEDQALLKAMTNSLAHRGPDAHGFYTDSGISLGHTRLSIIDLSAAGSQPMSNEDETIWIVFNGEIFNFQDLKPLLEEKGHRFKSNSDTEIIIHGYEEWGQQVVEKLNGMFTFAIWNEKTKELFLARDRFGVKPLYYYWDNRKLIFASEIKSILQDPTIKRKVNLKSAYSYLNLRYIPGDETLFAGIKKVPAGNTLLLKNGHLTIKKYWDLATPQNQIDPNAQEKIHTILTDSIKRRLVADVPVGVYLSGGLDSSAIVAIASKLKTDPLLTFSVGFDAENEVDELTKAKKIADYFGTNHHEMVIKEPIVPLLPKLLYHLDQPHGDPVIIPQFKLSELTRTKAKVVLSGEGADEVFGGYVQYKTMLKAQHLKRFPKSILNAALKATPIKILDKAFDYPSSIGQKGKEKIFDLINDLHDEKKSYLNNVSILSNNDRRNLLTFTADVPMSTFQKERNPLLNRMLYHDTKTWLESYVLYINDRMTMANSIEGRTPFLDYRLAEYANTLHPKYKIKGNTTKFILRKALKKDLPSFATKTKKHAFFMPLDKWYNEELKDLSEQLFTKTNVKNRGYFDYYHLKKIGENYNNSKLLYGKQLFTFINFELWERMFIDNKELPKKEVSITNII